MEDDRRTGLEVRCTACGTVYEQPSTASPDAGAGCPVCGCVAWLSALIPVAEDGDGNGV